MAAGLLTSANFEHASVSVRLGLGLGLGDLIAARGGERDLATGRGEAF